MLSFLADENFNGDVFEAVLRRLPTLDLVRVQDVGLTSSSDAEILQWASEQRRILLSHDFRTMPRFAYARIKSGRSFHGVFLIDIELPHGVVIDQLLYAAQCGFEEDYFEQITYFPLW